MLKTSYARNKVAKIFVLQSISTTTTSTMLKKWKNRDAVCNNYNLLLYDTKRLNHEREFLDLFKLIPQFVKFNMLQDKKECLSSIIRT